MPSEATRPADALAATLTRTEIQREPFSVPGREIVQVRTAIPAMCSTVTASPILQVPHFAQSVSVYGSAASSITSMPRKGVPDARRLRRAWSSVR